jgi:hypothetical protein
MLPERRNRLTRIRPIFWAFQQKYPFFGSNPFEFNSGAVKIGFHGRHFTLPLTKPSFLSINDKLPTINILRTTAGG